MKTFKRNAVIITVLLFVCLAVYLNWAYNNKAQTDDGDGATAQVSQTQDEQTQQDSLYYTENTDEQQSPESDGTDTTTAQTVSEYFDSVRLSRSQARDAAVTTLTMVSESDSATQDTIDEALKKISAMAQYSVLESEVESLIISKGFSDCVVYISDSGINVTVPAEEEGLSSADVARITDVVKSNTDFSTAELTITMVK